MFFTPKRLRLYLGALLVLQVCTLLAGIPIVRPRYIDFRTFYTAGYMLRTGHASQLYDYPTEERFQSALVSSERRALPLMTPPFSVPFFIPLSLLSFWTAFAVFAAINLFLLFASFVLLKPFLATLSGRWKPAPLLLFLSFLPAAIAFIMGQLSFVLLLLYCACFVSLRRKQDLRAGLFLSLALLKFQIALPIAVLFLLWRQWRFIAGFLAGGAFLTALSIRILGASAFLPYLHSLFSMTRSTTADRAIQVHLGIIPSLMPNLYGLVFSLTRGASWSHILILTLSLGVFLFTALQRPSLPLALLTAILVSYHLFFYDLTLLLLPLPLLVDHLLRNSTPRQPLNRRLLITQISLTTLLLVPFVRILISVDQTFWLALPILALTLTSPWWPSLRGEPDPAPLADQSLELATSLATT